MTSSAYMYYFPFCSLHTKKPLRIDEFCYILHGFLVLSLLSHLTTSWQLIKLLDMTMKQQDYVLLHHYRCHRRSALVSDLPSRNTQIKYFV
jgi:hypothetical protein